VLGTVHAVMASKFLLIMFFTAVIKGAKLREYYINGLGNGGGCYRCYASLLQYELNRENTHSIMKKAAAEGYPPVKQL